MADLSKAEKAALANIETQTDPVSLRALIANAQRMKSAAVERAAFLRLCSLAPEAAEGTVEHDVWQSIHALEELKRQAAGRAVRLTRTRQKITRDGEAKTVADLTLKRDASAGFSDLIDLGHPELTFEAVVLRHPDSFDDDIRVAARTRLTEAGVDPDTYTPT